jgi:hypothetical protein
MRGSWSCRAAVLRSASRARPGRCERGGEVEALALARAFAAESPSRKACHGSVLPCCWMNSAIKSSTKEFAGKLNAFEPLQQEGQFSWCASRERLHRAAKPISGSLWNDGFRRDSGPSLGDPCGRAPHLRRSRSTAIDPEWGLEDRPMKTGGKREEAVCNLRDSESRRISHREPGSRMPSHGRAISG